MRPVHCDGYRPFGVCRLLQCSIFPLESSAVRCPKVCTDRFIVNARHCLTAFFAAKLCNVLFAGHKALFCQNRRTVYIFQQGKASLVPYFGMGALYELLYLALIINVPDAAVAAELCACGLHSLRQLLREVIALLMPCTARNGRITLKARRSRTLRCGVAVDGQQQLRALGIDGLRPLAGLCGGIIAFTGTQWDVIRVGLQQRKQSLGGLGRHLFFFDDSPCARVASAVAGINADPVGRIAHHRPERFFPALISPGAEAGYTAVKSDAAVLSSCILRCLLGRRSTRPKRNDIKEQQRLPKPAPMTERRRRGPLFLIFIIFRIMQVIRNIGE